MVTTGGTDPRVLRSRRAIIDAAVDLMVERGFAGATIEAISATSGVAKTTIYRHWPDKQAVLRAAVESVIPVAAAPDSGSLREDLMCFALDVVRILDTPPTSGLIPALVDAAERDPDLARLLADFTAQRRAPLHAAVSRAAERGEIPPGADAALIGALTLGPLFYQRLLSRHPVEHALVERIVDAALSVVPGER